MVAGAPVGVNVPFGAIGADPVEVGWLAAPGDGEWWIGIRGVMVGATTFEAWAGAGIVSESDPIAEREETRDKLASVLSSVLADRV
jgi:isochorismate synthase EntC